MTEMLTKDKMYIINGVRSHPTILSDSLDKKLLIMEAKSYGLKTSKLNKLQLATNILEYLLNKEGNYLEDMTHIERECIIK